MISFGSVFLELVLGHVHELPRPGEEVFTDDFGVSCGGAVTSASAAARAGARAGLCTFLGDDLGSRVVADFCARAGVELSPSVRVPGKSAGVSVVLNFDGDRAFVTHLPPRPEDEQSKIGLWREVLRRERPRWCYLHVGDGVPDFLRDARDLGTKVVLDVSLGDEQYAAAVAECVPLADVFVPNEAELLRLTGAATLERAVSVGAAWGTPLVVKRGPAGALVAGRDGTTEVADGVRQVHVRDLTGAGDAFAGAMIAALLHGAALTEAVVAANAAGSEAVSRLGAVGEVEVTDMGAARAALGALRSAGPAAFAAASAAPPAESAAAGQPAGPAARQAEMEQAEMGPDR